MGIIGAHHTSLTVADTERSLRLEMIIVLLIAVEIVISMYHLLK